MFLQYIILSRDISKSDFNKLCTRYPNLAGIGIEHLGPKMWIMFNALKDGGVSMSSISRRPCTSLMENNVSFDDLKRILFELKNQGMIKRLSGDQYHLSDVIAYTLQQLSYDLTRPLSKFQYKGDLRRILRDCGYSSTYENASVLNDLTSDDSNKQTSQFKELMSDVAYAGLRLIIKLMNKAEESIQS